jgi:hypothetical protein
MGLPLKLTIRDHDTGQDYVYEDDRILIDVDTIDRRVRDLDVELEDMPMRIGPPKDAQNELLGYTDALGLPEGTFRAKLERPDGTLLMNGAVVMSDVLYDHKDRSWSFPLINQAPKDFWSLLKRSFTPPQLGSVTQESVECQVIRGGTLFEESRLFYQPKGVLEYILDDENISCSMPSKLWEYEVQFDAQGGSETVTFDSTNLLMSLGRRNEKTLVEEITNMAGWRIEVEYKGFPSSELDVTFLPTSWPAPAVSATLDDKIAADDYRISVEEDSTNWGLQLEQGTDVASPDPRNLEYADEKLEDVNTFAFPPSYGSVAPQVWRAAAPTLVEHIYDGLARPIDDREMIADLVSTGFKAPPIAPEYSRDVSDGREHQVYGRLLLEQTETLPLQATNEDDDLFLFECVEDADNGGVFASLMRHPQSGYEISDGILSHSPAWASSAYQQQTLRRRSQRELECSFIDIGPQNIGDPTPPVEVLGAKWMTYEEERDVSKNVNNLTLRRPEQPTDKVPDRPAFPSSPSGGEWTVVKPRGEYRTIDLNNGDDDPEDFFLIHWEPSPLQEVAETWYQVEYIDNANNTDWTRIDQGIGGGGDRVCGTALVYLFLTIGGNRSPSDNDIVGRVRPVMTYGKTGEWQTFRIEKN